MIKLIKLIIEIKHFYKRNSFIKEKEIDKRISEIFYCIGEQGYIDNEIDVLTNTGVLENYNVKITDLSIKNLNALTSMALKLFTVLNIIDNQKLVEKND